MTPEDPQPDTPIKRVERAIRSPYNILGVSVSIAVSAMLLSPWPVAVGIVAELIYLAVACGLMPKPSRRNADVDDQQSGVRTVLMPRFRAQSSDSSPAEVDSRKRDPDCLPPADLLTGDVQGRYLRLEATFRLIQLQLDQSEPPHRELLEHLRFLMDRFVYFAAKHETLHERLQAIVADARSLRPTVSPAAAMVELQLVYAAGETGEYRSLDEWVQAKMKVAHDGYEQALREVASQRDQRGDQAPDIRFEAHARHLLRCNKNVDKVGKTLLNLHYELQLLDKRFAMTSEEISTRRFEQVLADVKALVLQTQSLTRTVEDIEPFESASEYAAA
jgi:hypothetical protein